MSMFVLYFYLCRIFFKVLIFVLFSLHFIFYECDGKSLYTLTFKYILAMHAFRFLYSHLLYTALHIHPHVALFVILKPTIILCRNSPVTTTCSILYLRVNFRVSFSLASSHPAKTTSFIENFAFVTGDHW